MIRKEEELFQSFFVSPSGYPFFSMVHVRRPLARFSWNVPYHFWLQNLLKCLLIIMKIYRLSICDSEGLVGKTRRENGRKSIRGKVGVRTSVDFYGAKALLSPWFCCPLFVGIESVCDGGRSIH